jgi:hypothetical protein
MTYISGGGRKAEVVATEVCKAKDLAGFSVDSATAA